MNDYRKTVLESEKKNLISGAVIIRIVGLMVMAVGLAVGVQVINKAWTWFEDHQEIVSLSQKIEEHSGLNAFVGELSQSIVSFTDRAIPQADAYPNQMPAEMKQDLQDINQKAKKIASLNVCYFIAWLLGIILLGVISRIAFWAISEGGKLALYSADHQKQFKDAIRELVKEIKAAP